jgi:cellulose synthase/poly-beta-1,6-N-acetylglucosamine synthase-like glycosyltransferase
LTGWGATNDHQTSFNAAAPSAAKDAVVSESAELIAAVLEGLRLSGRQAEAVLAAARELDVDPLDFCSHRYGLGPDEALRRAAAWAGFAFSPVVPNTGGARVALRRIDNFASVRSIREPLYDREVTYIAPTCDDLVHLKAYAAFHPGIRRTTCIAPAHAIRTALARLSEEELLGESRQRLARRWPFALAHLDVGRAARAIFLGSGAILVGLVAASPWLATIVLLPLLVTLMLAPAILRLAAVVSPGSPGRNVPPPLSDRDLPVYSVLIPLRDEAAMVPQLGRAMRALDYPPEKLDIRFVVEAQSRHTVEAVHKLLIDPRFELLVVPDARPRTKPKALDYALPFVRGKYVVVYDAEDVPDPDQLRLAAAVFADDPDIDCLQAELMIDNGYENIITGLFAGEYAGQFGVLMPALVRWGLPIPLGGTSNHFVASTLREAGGWDAFNVTEDADLGVRLARLRYRTHMLGSRTFEEAPITLEAWLNQRTRWMKGWMQTFIVHNRRPAGLLADLGWRGFLCVELYLGSLILSPILHTLFVAGLLVRLATAGPLPFTPFNARAGLALIVFVCGYGGAFAVTLAGLRRTGQRHLLAIQALLPLYWILHSVATIRAAWQLVRRPHFWAKTAHGVTHMDRRLADLAPAAPALHPVPGFEPPADRQA